MSEEATNTQGMMDADIDFPMSSASTSGAVSSSHSDMSNSTQQACTSYPSSQADVAPNSPTAQLVDQYSASTATSLAKLNDAVTPGQRAKLPVLPSTATIRRDNAVYAIAMLKDLGEILEKIPYVKALAGTTLVILRMWEVREPACFGLDHHG